MEKVRAEIKDISEEMLLEMRVGVFEWDDKQSIQPIVALDFAKIACDSIKNKITASVQYYSKEIHKQLEIYEYVSSHIDVALEYHWIKLYYQPVVRTLSKELCSMEALARWVDLIYGFLNPGQFISALEDSGQIYKLDTYIVRETCRLMRERILFDNGLCMQAEIQKFHDAGYPVWMDDFGSGYGQENRHPDFGRRGGDGGAV